MPQGIAGLLICQLAGEAIQRATGLPLPGPVIGMVILFAGLLIRGGVPDGLKTAARGLLDHLALLFVPAGVGVVLHLALVAEEWLPIAAALVGSTVLTIAVTALVMRLMLRLTGAPADTDASPPPGQAGP